MMPGRALNEPIVGNSAEIVNVAAALAPPAVEIVTLRGPRAALASITNAAVIDRPVAATSGPFTLTTLMPLPPTAMVVAPGTKPVPRNVTLTVEPRMPDCGVIDVRVGAGTPIVKGCVAEPPAVVNVTVRGPSSALASTVRRAVSAALFATLISLTFTPVPETETAVAPLTKPVPAIVATIVLPAIALFGVTALSAGAAAVTTNVKDPATPTT